MEDDIPTDLQGLSWTNKRRLKHLRENYFYYSYGPLPSGGRPIGPAQQQNLAKWDKFLEDHPAG